LIYIFPAIVLIVLILSIAATPVIEPVCKQLRLNPQIQGQWQDGTLIFKNGDSLSNHYTLEDLEDCDE
jgi:hypothetical protein